MDFSVKLQELRKKSGLTQEELGEKLYVSRTAISKWESGKGYPNIESLKSIAKFFDVSVDDLLSSKELLVVAEEDDKYKRDKYIDLTFGLVDISFILLLCLPLFAQRVGDVVYEVLLFNLTQIKFYLKLVFLSLLSLNIFTGVLTFALRSARVKFWSRYKIKISLILSAVLVALFSICLQPYPSIFTFVFLIIKVIVLIKK